LRSQAVTVTAPLTLLMLTRASGAALWCRLIGVSASAGSYLRPSATRTLAPGHGRGDYRQLVLGQDTVERATRVLGKDHPTTLAAAFNFGLDLSAAGRTEEAQSYHGPTLERYRRVLGEAHPATIAATEGKRADCDIDPMGM